MLPPFHLALPVHDLARARAFYGEVLGCPEGRSSDHWVDFDFFGHQLVTHLCPEEAGGRATNPVDGHEVPARHFGVVLGWSDFGPVEERLRVHGIPFLLEPYLRFEGEPGEQRTMFVRDPSGNALEFKSFRDPGRLFSR